ncbi:MAG: adenosylcobinamide-GDP ribazoletransferase [Rhodobacteraceae bacterium]|nr:adenosylcobinamide-GDP ribazoletransferase [Paracoccaceae bacterium]
MHDVAAAFSLLTRLPVPVDHARAGARAAAAVWAYPLVGSVIGLLGGLVGMLFWRLGAPLGIAAAGILGTTMLLTGAMHEDGLADCADGLAGGMDRERRLEIMKDSRIGAFGAAALVVVLIARWSGSEAVLWTVSLPAFVAIGAVSRLPMVLAMYLMSPARATGMAADVGRPQFAAVALAGGLALVICIVALGFTGFTALIIGTLAALPLFLYAQHKIGGYTGDILGGSQQLAEIATLATVVAVLGQT